MARFALCFRYATLEGPLVSVRRLMSGVKYTADKIDENFPNSFGNRSRQVGSARVLGD